MKNQQLLFIKSITLKMGLGFFLLVLTSCNPFTSILSEIPQGTDPCQQWIIDANQVYSKDQESYKIPVTTQKLFVKNDIGSIHINKSLDENVYVKLSKYCSNPDYLDKIRLTIDDFEGRKEIQTHYWASLDTLNAFSRIDVYIPQLISNLEVKTKGANVQINEYEGNASIYNSCGNTLINKIKGETDIQSEHGDVTVISEQGSAKISTTSGDITFKGNITPNKDYNFYSTNGSIYFTPINQYGKIYLETSSGYIDIGDKVQVDRSDAFSHGGRTGDISDDQIHLHGENDSSTGISKSFAPKKISGKLGVGDTEIYIETINGNIYVR